MKKGCGGQKYKSERGRIIENKNMERDGQNFIFYVIAL